jgi:hypothetical protein
MPAATYVADQVNPPARSAIFYLRIFKKLVAREFGNTGAEKGSRRRKFMSRSLELSGIE